MNKRVEIGLGSAAHSIPVVQVEGKPLKPGSAFHCGWTSTLFFSRSLAWQEYVVVLPLLIPQGPRTQIIGFEGQNATI